MSNCRYCEALSSVIGRESVVEYRDGVLHIGGQVPTDAQLAELVNEAELLSKTSLWMLLTETVKAQALELGIRNAKDFDQLMFAKAMLHVVEVQQSVSKAVKEEKRSRDGKKVV